MKPSETGLPAGLGKPIAYGRTAEIYAWQGGRILKLFYNWFSLDDIEYEMRNSLAVQAAGLHVPAVGEFISINGRSGLVYERVDGISMIDALIRRPWSMFSLARSMAELHATMHAGPFETGLPDQRQWVARKIRTAESLPDRLRDKALAALENLPGGDRVCHGDFHPGNIIITPQAPVVIDWVNATRGNPLADLARTAIMALGTAATGPIFNPFARALPRLFNQVYLRHYFKLRPGGQAEYSRWLPVVAAARLNENITELEAWLVEQVDKGL